MPIATSPITDETLAMHLAADLFYRALLEAGKPVKASEAASRAARAIGRTDVDLRLARVVLNSHSSRFASTERKWTLWTRYADPTRTTERTVTEVVQAYGLPMSTEALVREVAAIVGRPAEALHESLERLLRSSPALFQTSTGDWGLREWLLNTDGDTEEDILFYNDLSEDDLRPYDEHASLLPGGEAGFLDAVGDPVPTRVLQLLLRRMVGADYDPAAHYASLLSNADLTCLSGAGWIGPNVRDRLAALFPSLADREVVEQPDADVAEPVEPLTISDENRAQLVERVLAAEDVARGKRLLEEEFEVSPGDPTFDADLATVSGALQADERLRWLGADRFTPHEALPPYVFLVPESLAFADEIYLDAEGNEVDLLLEDDGFDGGLERDIRNPVAQDVLDEEPVAAPELNPPATARLILKYHHREIGTFPLAQLPPGFFATEPEILQVDLVLPNRQECPIWVNNSTRLVYGLLDWYQTLPVDSGAVFYLERQASDRYPLTYGEETEPAMFVSRNRANELHELGRQAEEEELPTFEIVRRVLEHYRKGIEYITVLTEVNIARRVTRRMVASILSAYHCFYQRGGAWVYDQRKLTQGFDKSKRKYLRKS
ncbi:MAG TPA: hypothetical protein VLH79_00685 [Chthonomonadales bacterium]|nr:hypothetical protein [Chthonomonadales bacterium]